MKKRILFIHHAGGIGGAPRSLSFLISQLNKEKYEPIVLILRKGPAENILRDAGAKVLFYKGLFSFNGTTVSGMDFKLFLANFIGFFPTLLKSYFIIKKVKPHILHLNTTCLFSFAIASKIRNKNIPVISHVREPILKGFWGSFLRIGNKIAVDGFIGISNYDLESVKIKKQSKQVVFNSYNFSKAAKNIGIHRNEVRSQYKIGDKIVLLYLCRISPSNGLLELVSFFIKNKDEFRDVCLMIVGFDPLDKSGYVNEVVKLCSEYPDIFKLINKTLDVTPFLDACDLVISPFVTPHFARSVIEAAAFSKAVIVSNVGCQNELVIDNQTGWLYNNENELKEVLIDVTNNPDKIPSFGKNARQYGIKTFNSIDNNKKIVDFYESFFNKDG